MINPQDVKQVGKKQKKQTKTWGNISVVRSSTSFQKSPFLLPALRVVYKPLFKPSWRSCRSSFDAPPQKKKKNPTNFQLHPRCQLWRHHYFLRNSWWGYRGALLHLTGWAGHQVLVGTSTWGWWKQNCTLPGATLEHEAQLPGHGTWSWWGTLIRYKVNAYPRLV